MTDNLTSSLKDVNLLFSSLHVVGLRGEWTQRKPLFEVVACRERMEFFLGGDFRELIQALLPLPLEHISI